MFFIWLSISKCDDIIVFRAKKRGLSCGDNFAVVVIAPVGITIDVDIVAAHKAAINFLNILVFITVSPSFCFS